MTARSNLDYTNLGIVNEKNILDPPSADRGYICWARFGRVGITFRPEKYDRLAMTGEWDRDLTVDLDTVRDRGAAAVVTLAGLFASP